MTSTAIIAYDPDLPIHMKDGMILLSKARDNVQNCPLCKNNSCYTKYFQVCENGCISCQNCEKIIGSKNFFFKDSRRGNKCIQCNGKCLEYPIYNKAYTDLASNVINMDSEITHGLQQIKNHGYVTEGMANGEKTPDWVPIPRNQAIKEAMDFLKNDPNLKPVIINKKKGGKPINEDFETEEDFNKAFETYETQKNERAVKAKDKKRKLENYDIIVEELENANKKIAIMEDMLMKHSISLKLA